jgi:hypothetical protein
MRPLLAALACAMATAHADSSWICPAPGNALNPAGVNPYTAGRWMDEEGMGTRIPTAHSPNGQAYNIPYDNPDEEPFKKSKDWITGGFVEAGGLHVSGDAKSAGFLNYKDLKTGGYLDTFGAWGEKPSEARYYEATGGAVGMDDQFYHVQFGRYNDWKVTAYYDGTPQVFTTTYRSLWTGLGSSNLTLTGLTPGGTTSAAATQANIQKALAKTPDSELEVVRKKAGLRYDANIGEAWKFYASATDQRKEGSQPFGAVFGGGGGGGNLEIPQSVDNSTYDLVTGLRYADPKNSFNLRASASFFRNDIDTMTFQNPLYITTNGSNGLSPTLFTQGRFDFAPDNEAFNVKGEYSRRFPELYNGYFTSAVALGTMRQNDPLIAPTQYPLTGGTVNPGNVSLANNWNTTQALSRQSAETRMDTLLGDFGLLLRPTTALDVRGKLRYYETRNEMAPYQACNPLTGQWGRLLNDGSGLSIVTANTVTGANPAGTYANAYNAAMCDLAAVRALNLAPVAGNIPIASVPYDYRQLVASVGADYRVGRASSVGGVLERETFHRDFRERDETWEDKVKLSWVDRGLLEGTIRVSYEYDDRAGSAYNTNPYLPFYSASFGPVPVANTVNLASWFHSIDQFRSFDLADRKQNTLNSRVDYAITDNLDGAFTLQLRDADFPSALGRTGHQRNGFATVDLSYRAGEKAVVYGYYSFQAASMAQKGVQPNSCIAGSTYYFYSDGRIANAAIGAPAPTPPAGTTLIATQNVVASNWTDVCGNASATSPLFPDSRGWNVQSKDRNDVLGLGLKYDFGRMKFEGDFTRSLARTRIDYGYNAAALGLSPVQAALAGSGLSDMTFAQNIFNASALIPITPNFMVRLLARYEMGKIRDWHYDGVAANPMPTNNSAYLDAGPQDYRATVIGILFHVRL